MIRAISRLAAIASASMMILALAAGTAPANTPSASLQYANQATLQENGTVNVTLYYLCQPSFTGTVGFVSVEVEQIGALGVSPKKQNAMTRSTN